MSGPVKNILAIYDFNNNEIRNVVIQNLASNPGGKSDGYIFVNSADKKLRIFLDGVVKTVLTEDITSLDITGINGTSFTLDQDNTGQGVTQEIYFNRGTTQGDQQLRWNETSDKFELFQDQGQSTLQRLDVQTINGYTIQHNTHQQNTDVGTNSSTFYFGTGGVKLKTTSNVLEVRNNQDNQYQQITALEYNGLKLQESTSSFTIAGGTSTEKTLTVTQTATIQHSTHQQNTDTGTTQTNFTLNSDVQNGEGSSLLLSSKTQGGTSVGQSLSVSNTGQVELESYTTQTFNSLDTQNNIVSFESNGVQKQYIDKNGVYHGNIQGQLAYALTNGDGIQNFSYNGSAQASVTANIDGTTLQFDSSTPKKIKVNQSTSSTQNTIVLRDQSGDFSQHEITATTVTGLSQPVNDTDQANKLYVDSIAQGIDVKQSVRVATTQNITLSGTQTIDGIQVVQGDRVLVKNQTTKSTNGIYVVQQGQWSRQTDANTSDKVHPGMFTFVEEGNTNQDSGWVLITDQPITLGTTELEFEQFSGAGQIVAGNGLTKTGNTLNVGNGDGITVSADSISVTVDGTTIGLSGTSPNKSIQVLKVPNQLTFSTGLTSTGTFDGSAQRTISVTYGTTSGTAVEGPHVGTTTGIHGVGTGQVVGTTLTQILTNKTLTSPIMQTSIVLKNTTRNITLKWAEPQTQQRDVTFGDPGANDYVAYLSATQTLQNKTLTLPTIDQSGVKLRTNSSMLEVRNNQNSQYQGIKQLTFYRSSDGKEVTYKYQTTITGTGSDNQFTITHGIGSRDVQVQVFTNASPYDEVEVGVERTDTNNVEIYFAQNIPLNAEYRVVVVG